MINPMTSRTYQGYIRADQSPVEEENELEERDLESGRRSRGSSSGTSRAANARSPSAGAGGQTRNSGTRDAQPAAGGSGSDMNSLRPNIKREDDDKRGDSSDDEVPQSFIIETPASRANAAYNKASSPRTKGKAKASNSSAATPQRGQPLHSVAGRKVPPSGPILPVTNVSIPPRPSDLDQEEHQARPYSTSAASNSGESNGTGGARRPRMGGLDAYERALWNWVNVYNLDAFLQEVYYYYEGKGIYSIALARGLNLLTMGFVIGFSTFLLGCVDYSKLWHGSATRLSEIVVNKCVSKFHGLALLFFILFLAFYIWQIISFVLDIHRLIDMYNFYTHLLKVPDADIQTISWPEIVRRIGAIREENPITALSSKNSAHGITNDTTTAKLDAHDIANRIMRQENYLIALFNKELLDLRVPLPKPLGRFVPEEKGKGKVLTQALEWNLRFCLMDYLFDHHGRVRKVFLKSKNRRVLIEGLRRRFIFMGILNAIFAPFIVLYLIMYSFFRYFEEYHKDPSSIGGRRYTSYSKWKFREFNELHHFFVRRLDESYPVANIYIGQFPNEKLSLIMRFVSFVAGAFTAVLVLVSVIDPDLVLNFEISPHRNVAFYVAVFGGILTVARGMIPEENRVFDPELLMTEVITYTHYMPEEWKSQLHSKLVHQEFGELFAMKVLIFAQELVSVVLTPFVLWFSLPDCAPAIIDFFREFSVHVDGRGYVCSFAEFNFERHGNVKFGAPTRANDTKMISNEGKMEKSFLNFKAANPDWNPTDPSGSLYLSRIADLTTPFGTGVGVGGGPGNSALPLHARDAHNSIAHLYRRRHFRDQPPHQPVPGVFQDHVHFVTSPGGASSSSVQLPQVIGEEGSVNVGGGKTLAEKAQEYDWALKQSQNLAGARRAGGLAASRGGMGASILLAGSTTAGGIPAASVYSAQRAQDLAKTVVLEDSHVNTPPSLQKALPAQKDSTGEESEMIGGSEVELGESEYVDGAKRERIGYGDGQDGGFDADGEEFLEELEEDGGVLGLLAQIYGRRDGPAAVRGI